MDHAKLGLLCPLKPISKWIMPNWASHSHFSPFLNGLCHIGPFMPVLAHLQMDYVKIGPLMPTMAIKVDFGFIQRIYYLFDSS